MQDFFFGEMYQTEKLICQFHLFDVNKLGQVVSPDFFNSQLNRVLLSNKNIIDLYDGTSSPDFPEFIKYIPVNNIGMIQIGQRTDVNDNVNATLDCSITLVNGIVRVTAHWCAYKELRASEIVSTLLNPLIENDLISKTFIKIPNGNIKALSEDKEIATKQLFTLSGYPD